MPDSSNDRMSWEGLAEKLLSPQTLDSPGVAPALGRDAQIRALRCEVDVLRAMCDQILSILEEARAASRYTIHIPTQDEIKRYGIAHTISDARKKPQQYVRCIHPTPDELSEVEHWARRGFVTSKGLENT